MAYKETSGGVTTYGDNGDPNFKKSGVRNPRGPAGLSSAVAISGNGKTGPCFATYAAQVSCPNGVNSSYRCPLYGAGCYGENDKVGIQAKSMNAKGGMPEFGSTEATVSVEDVARDEAAAIAGQVKEWTKKRKNPFVRVHVVGDCVTPAAAKILSDGLQAVVTSSGVPGAKNVWNYTHGWRDVPRSAWASNISVLASCDTIEDLAEAHRKGYGCAIVVPEYVQQAGKQVSAGWKADNGFTIVPCPNEIGIKDSKGKVKQCIDCWLCMKDEMLRDKKIAIAFAPHGTKAKQVAKNYVQITKKEVLENAVEGESPAVENPKAPGASLWVANTALHEAGRTYYETQGDAIRAVEGALRRAGYNWSASSEHWDHVAYETSKHYGPIDVGDDGVLAIDLYRMPSGNYELTAVMGKGSTPRHLRRANPKGDVGDFASKAMMEKHKAKLLRGGWVHFPLGRDVALQAYARPFKGTTKRDLAIRVFNLDTNEPLSDPYSLGPLSVRAVNKVGAYVHLLIDAIGDTPDNLNGSMEQVREFFDSAIRSLYYTSSRKDKMTVSGSRMVNPAGRDYMLSYLPAKSGSFRTIPYSTMADAAAAMQARIGPSTLKMQIRDMRTTPSIPVVEWDQSRGARRVNPVGTGGESGYINIHSTFDRLDAGELAEHMNIDHGIDARVTSRESTVRKGKLYWMVIVAARDKDRALDVRNDWLDEAKHKEAQSNPAGPDDTFTRAYIEAALWSSTDNNDKPLDYNYSRYDLSSETEDRMEDDCRKFQELAEKEGIELSDLKQAGHDFWLTRNDHGSGFWDGDWPEPDATKLTKLAKRFGEYDLYVGDNGQIYGSGGRTVNPSHGARDHNPSSASEMFETFHGAPSTETLEVTDTLHYHDSLATLGDAIEMIVKLAKPHRGNIKIGFDGKTKVACNPSGTQLYMVDGDQSLNLSAMGFKGARKGKHGTFTDEKDKVLVGEIVELTYRAKKGFDNFKLTDYYHGLGEDSGVRPSLVYDLLNKQMEIVGGQYKVLDVGIVN